LNQEEHETDDTGMAPGDGSGGGSEAVTDQHPEEEGGPLWAPLLTVVLSVLILLAPVFFIVGRFAGPSGVAWTWAAILSLIAATAVFVLYAIIRKSI
jgi:hypothetical protein